jgi:hypothetical protein
MAEIVPAPWLPLRDMPETDFLQCRYVDLLVKADSSGTLFRVPDCFVRDGEWWSQFYHYPLRVCRWHPVAWMPIPKIPSVEEFRNLFSEEGCFLDAPRWTPMDNEGNRVPEKERCEHDDRCNEPGAGAHRSER